MILTPKRLVTAALVVALAIPGIAMFGCTASTETNVPAPTNLPVRTAEVSVFFSTGRSLIEEKRVIDADRKYEDTTAKLLVGDAQRAKIAVVQPVAKVRSVSFKDGVITVDWDRAILSFDADAQEKVLAWAAFLETYGQFPEVKKVAFSVEGKTTGTIDGKKIEDFWGNVSLHKMPWDVLRPASYAASVAASSSVAASGTAGKDGTKTP